MEVNEWGAGTLRSMNVLHCPTLWIHGALLSLSGSYSPHRSIKIQTESRPEYRMILFCTSLCFHSFPNSSKWSIKSYLWFPFSEIDDAVAKQTQITAKAFYLRCIGTWIRTAVLLSSLINFDKLTVSTFIPEGIMLLVWYTLPNWTIFFRHVLQGQINISALHNTHTVLQYASYQSGGPSICK